MELFDLQQAIVKKTIPNFLVLFGYEYAFLNIYIQQISKVLNQPITTIDNVNVVLSGNKSLSIANNMTLYVSRYNKEFLSNEKYWTNINKALGKNYLILVYADIDKRCKFYKQFKDTNIVEFKMQDEATIRSALKKNVSLSDSNMSKLIAGCSNSYGRCLLEVDKIKNAKGNKYNDDECYEKLVKSGVIYQDTGDIIFEFIDNVLTRNPKCIKQYQELIEKGEANIKILSLLYTAFRNQLIVESSSNPSIETTGLTQFFIFKAKEKKGHFSLQQLKNNLFQIMQTEQGIKQGQIDEGISVDYILAMIL